MVDGGLRALFRKNITAAMWTSLESPTTGKGIPDSHFIFPGGHEGMVEYKKIRGWAMPKSETWTFQIAWHMRYARFGGRSFVAIKRKDKELWLVPGGLAKRLDERGLVGIWDRSDTGVRMWSDPWQWDHVAHELKTMRNVA
jgi:hypothetical protein